MECDRIRTPKVISKAKRPQKYAVINKDEREKLIKLVKYEGLNLLEASKSCGIALSTARRIVRLFEDEGRIGKKESRAKKDTPMRIPKTSESDAIYNMVSSQLIQGGSIYPSQGILPSWGAVCRLLELHSSSFASKSSASNSSLIFQARRADQWLLHAEDIRPRPASFGRF
eukprot:TRINITY_DN12586_c0_g1_i2.p1 TRINITY_DN12586_c0_g1~~TRINITY_DN12586_c0_g1_i2.p1  ORF type:complete len:171 (-),score=2.42 TRINITY_DN12586_c0_g1_i2:106-618(-)